MSVTPLQSVNLDPSRSPGRDWGPHAASESAARTRGHAEPAPVRPVSVELATSRAFVSNPNHHLWKNGRLWWIAFTLIHDGWRQERVRQSLGTDSLQEARRRRDSILTLFARGPLPAHACVDPEGCDVAFDGVEASKARQEYAGLRCACAG
jgi:hypothetical protein